jgi:hypothetical protein
MHLIQQSTWKFLCLFPAAENYLQYFASFFGHFEWEKEIERERKVGLTLVN